jgi:hypothetical protein
VVLDGGSEPVLFWAGPSVSRWNGTAHSVLEGPFSQYTGGLMYALAIFNDSPGDTLFAGGQFLDAGEIASSRIAAWRCVPPPHPPAARPIA